MPLPAMLLACAAIACVVLGVVGARRAGGSPGPPPLPLAVRVPARVPLPATWRAALGGRPPADTIAAAGLPVGATAAALARARAGGTVAGLLAGGAMGLLAPAMLVLAPVGAVAGRMAPDRAIRARARRRRQAVVVALPDLLDLMVICVEAGMALDPALSLAAARLGGPLGDEVRATLDDQALGTPRRRAYEALATRTGSDDLARLVASLLQAEELGTPLSRALAGQADALRASRRQRARDRAARAAPRIQLVVALVMVPGAMLLILGIMLMELAAQVGAVMGA